VRVATLRDASLRYAPQGEVVGSHGEDKDSRMAIIHKL